MDVLLRVALVLATFMLAIFSFLMWRATRELGNATRHLANVTELGQEEIHRPRLVITTVKRDMETSSLRIRIRNIGSGAATRIVVNVGNREWQGDGGVYATRVEPEATNLEPGDEAEWSVSKRAAHLTEGKLPLGIIYQGFQLRRGASNPESWGAYYSDEGIFSVD